MTELQKIASTLSIDLQPVGPLTERDHARLVDCLSQQIGSSAANIFAEPVTNRDGSRTDWYGRGKGPAVPLTALDEDEAGELRARLAAAETEIEALVESLASSSHPDDRSMASALTHALIVPDASFIYALDGSPVLTAWGYSHARKPGYRGGLSKIVPLKAAPHALASPARYVGAEQPENPYTAEEPAAVNAQAAARGCFPVLLWLLFALLVLAILFLLLRACAFGISIPFINIGNCPLPQRIAAIGELQREIASLEGKLLDRQDGCQTQGLAFGSPGSAPPPTSLQSSIDDRLAERNAQGGSLQISLVWDGYADLDLSLKCSTGEIGFQSLSGCGGKLDIDSNNGSNTTAQPVENIVWTDERSVPSGDVPITVTLFNMRNERRSAIPYTIRIQSRNGDTVLSERVIEGVADPGMIGRPVVVGKLN